MKKLFIGLALLVPLAGMGEVIRYEGKVGGSYPIVMELTKQADGGYAGRYAYTSTLKKNGDEPCSWLYIKPDVDEPYSKWIVKDCKSQKQETWFDVNFNGPAFSARLKTAKGKYYDVTAHKEGSAASVEPLDSYFRQHLGDYVCEIKMFDDARIKKRLIGMMGEQNFRLMKEIYDTQVPIEYTKGMYYASGFESHNCCDPYVLWAYDTHNNCFYVWILKDEKEYAWSENGEISYEFKALISSAL